MIILLDFVKRESEVSQRRILFMTVLTGLASSLLLALVNLSTEEVWDHHIDVYSFITYMVVFALFIYSVTYSLFQMVLALEGSVHKVYLRIAEKIRHSEVGFIEHAEASDIHARLTQNRHIVSQSAMIIAGLVQAGVILLCNVLYIAWLSPLTLFMVAIVMMILIFQYIAISKEVAVKFQDLSPKETELFSNLDQLLKGFKELKVNQHKGNNVWHQCETLLTETEQLNIEASSHSLNVVTYHYVALFLLLALFIFIVPLYMSAQTPIIFKVTAAILFIISPLNLVALGLPTLVRAEVALKNLYDFEVNLDKVTTKNHSNYVEFIEEFRSIQLTQVLFYYLDEENNPAFSVGPLSLTFHRGDLLFLTGENGSGKSTLLKLLTGLYCPKQGHLYLDEDQINETIYPQYRALFSVVFSEFHLFDRFYGLKTEIGNRQIKELLRLVKLEKKIKYVEGKLIHVNNLSTNQRKRLAFVVAILENKPILVFDGLLVDQDQEFKEIFYEFIIPDLKQQGKTIIMVTHDEKYFHIADHVLKMKEGQLFPLSDV